MDMLRVKLKNPPKKTPTDYRLPFVSSDCLSMCIPIYIVIYIYSYIYISHVLILQMMGDSHICLVWHSSTTVAQSSIRNHDVCWNCCMVCSDRNAAYCWSFGILFTQWIGLRENLQIFTGKHHFWWEIPWFPVDFPLNQSIDSLMF